MRGPSQRSLAAPAGHPRREGFLFAGPLSETTRRLWQLKRRGGRRGHLVPLQGPTSVLIWGHPPSTKIVILGVMAAFAAVAWLLGQGQPGVSVWPLWAMLAIFGLTLVANALFDERLSLDLRRQRWCYRRGWRLIRVREESGGFEDLAGLTLEELRRPLFNPGTAWVLALDFTDGVRFCDLGQVLYSEERARAEATRVAEATGLPLTIAPLER